MVTIGQSDEGREIVFVVASKEGAKTPEALAANGRPTLLVQGGIHSGEIDGKDASMMLLRDMTVRGTKRALLDKANLIVLPVISVDGHERRSVYSRINQRGPRIQGWRTNGRNLNLNRDYAKIDTPELQALVRALGVWPVDLYYDVHVTDGADYEYDITYGWSAAGAYSPAIKAWLDGVLRPGLDRGLLAAGHVPGPLIFQRDGRDASKGIVAWTSPPRFSNGYGELRHLPTVLVENHSLKNFRRRVLGTYVLIESTLGLLGEEGKALRDATARDRARRPTKTPLSFGAPEGEAPRFRYRAIESELVDSPVFGAPVPVYNGRPKTLDVPVALRSEPELVVELPKAYWVPAAWPEVIERLAIHGIAFERVEAPRTLELDFLRLEGAKLEGAPYEGHARVALAGVRSERREETFAPGSVRVPLDQPLGELAAHLLDPRSGDSFFRWGFFLEVLNRTEYSEAYALEPLARRMLAEDPALAAEFERRLATDEAFRDNPRARMMFFYERTPYYDERYLLYPVGFEPREP